VAALVSFFYGAGRLFENYFGGFGKTFIRPVLLVVPHDKTTTNDVNALLTAFSVLRQKVFKISQRCLWKTQ